MLSILPQGFSAAPGIEPAPALADATLDSCHQIPFGDHVEWQRLSSRDYFHVSLPQVVALVSDFPTI